MATEVKHLLKLHQVKARVAKSRSSIYSAVKDGTFPKPVQIGSRAVAWASDQIDAWIDNRIKSGRPANDK